MRQDLGWAWWLRNPWQASRGLDSLHVQSLRLGYFQAPGKGVAEVKTRFTPGQLVRLYPPKGRVDMTHVRLRSTDQSRSVYLVAKGTMVMFLREAGGGDQAFILLHEKTWLTKMRFMRPCKRPSKLYDNNPAIVTNPR